MFFLVHVVVVEWDTVRLELVVIWGDFFVHVVEWLNHIPFWLCGLVLCDRCNLCHIC